MLLFLLHRLLSNLYSCTFHFFSICLLLCNISEEWIVIICRAKNWLKNHIYYHCCCCCCCFSFIISSLILTAAPFTSIQSGCSYVNISEEWIVILCRAENSLKKSLLSFRFSTIEKITCLILQWKNWKRHFIILQNVWFFLFFTTRRGENKVLLTISVSEIDCFSKFYLPFHYICVASFSLRHM